MFRTRCSGHQAQSSQLPIHLPCKTLIGALIQNLAYPSLSISQVESPTDLAPDSSVFLQVQLSRTSSSRTSSPRTSRGSARAVWNVHKTHIAFERAEEAQVAWNSSFVTMKAAPLLIAWHNESQPIYSAHFDPNGKGRLATAGG